MSATQFIHEDAAKVIAEIKQRFEELSGRILADGDAEMLLLNALAYRELILRAGVNYTGRQGILKYATGIMLDYWGDRLDTPRLTPDKAICKIQFNLVTGHNGVTIPINTRVQSVDGKVVFATTKDVVALDTDIDVTIDCECLTEGVEGNGYSTGQISVLVNPIAFVGSAANTEVTQGGANEEDDEAYRKRLQLAPSKFSTAGPEDAYKYFAFTASPSIVDVSVQSTTPGTVQVYPLLDGGVIPGTPILDEVEAVLNDKKIRPLTDTVEVLAPTVEDYTIDVDLTLFTGQNLNAVKAEVEQLLAAYTLSKKNSLGIDVVKSQISAICMLKDKVYKCAVNDPTNDIVVGVDTYTNCTGITVNVIGFANG
jgi:phage-related baseplate assembly protein